MQRITTFAEGTIVEDEFLNEQQDNILGIAQVPGLTVGLPYLYSSDGISVGISAMTGMMVSDNPNQTLQSSSEGSYFPAGLGNNTWYYLYLYNNSGVRGVEHSTAVPDAAQVFRNDTTTRRYIGCFRTDGSANIEKFVKVGGYYQWRFQRQVVTAVTVTAGTTLSIATSVPPHCRLAEISALLSNNGTTAQTATFLFTGNTGTVSRRVSCGPRISSGNPVYNSDTFSVLLNASREFDYTVPTDGTMDAWVNGFYE